MLVAPSGSPNSPINADETPVIVANTPATTIGYPPSVQGVGPWGGDGSSDVGANEPAKPAERASVRDRSQRREARAMSVMAMETGRGQPEPETLEREAAVPKEWEAALDRQEDFIEELLGGSGWLDGE